MSKETSFTAQQFGRVAVLMGGDSSERDISLMSGNAVLEALLRKGVDAVGIDVDRDIFESLRQQEIDRVFIMLHGKNGEDGTMQAAMELIGMPYTGSGVLGSALAMDKVRCKQLWMSLGLNTPDFVILDADSDWENVIKKLGTVFVKPVKEGSSIGIAKVSTAPGLQKAYREASRFDDCVIAEKFIQGREFSVPIVGQDIYPPVELKAKNEFYDYDAKYFSDETEYYCPCDLSEEKSREVRELSWKAYQAAACEGWGRVDVMQDENEEFWLLEVNTVPGMTGHSLVPMSAQAAGLGFDDLVVKILQESVE